MFLNQNHQAITMYVYKQRCQTSKTRTVRGDCQTVNFGLCKSEEKQSRDLSYYDFKY